MQHDKQVLTRSTAKLISFEWSHYRMYSETMQTVNTRIISGMFSVFGKETNQMNNPQAVTVISFKFFLDSSITCMVGQNTTLITHIF